MSEQNPQSPQFFSAPPEGGNRALLLAVCFFVPIVGIILGIMFMTKADEASRKFGRHALIAAIAFFVLFFACFACYFIFVMSMSLAPFFLIPSFDSGSLLPILLSAI